MRITSPTSWARQKTTGTIKSLRIAFDEDAEALKEKARKLLSGNIPTRTFIQLGHPLSRKRSTQISIQTKTGRWRTYSGVNRSARAKGGVVPLLPINAQTHKLVNSLRLFKRGNHFSLYFVDRKAKWRLAQFGTRTTIPSGFWEEMTRFQNLLRKNTIKKAQQMSKKSRSV